MNRALLFICACAAAIYIVQFVLDAREDRRAAERAQIEAGQRVVQEELRRLSRK